MQTIKRLWLLRHGQTAYNAEGKIQGRGINAPLNELGRIQALKLAEEINTKVDASKAVLFASAMLRAVQTAEPISAKMNLDINQTPALEELNYGVFEGKEFEQVEGELNLLMQDWGAGRVDVAPEGGESPREVFTRANQFLMPILNIDKSKTDIVVVAHGRVLRILLSHYLYGDLRHMSRIQHHNANINCIEYANGKFKSLIINDVTHLKFGG